MWGGIMGGRPPIENGGCGPCPDGGASPLVVAGGGVGPPTKFLGGPGAAGAPLGG